MEEWKIIKACDYCYNVTDGTHDSPKQKEVGKHLITSKHIKENRIDFEHAYKISEEDYKKIISRSKVDQWDILISMIGAYCGFCCIESSTQTDYAIKNVGLFKIGDELKCRWLYYYLTSPQGKEQLSILRSGSSQPYIPLGALRNLDIPVPSTQYMELTISILKSLDDKIELNRRINENLEQQAQALFNYYFIEHSEILGDYEKGNLTEIATYTNGLPMQKFRPQDEEKGMPVLKIKELGQGQTDNSSDICSENIANEYKVTNGDVIFSWSGTLMVKVWCGGLCGLNQHLFKVTSEKYPKWYYYFWTKFHLNKFIRIAQDKAVTMGHIRRGDLESSEVLVPKMDILAKLNEIINPIFNQIIGIECENRNLAQLRDTLLPRLMSGELAITDVDYRSIFQ